MSEGCGKDFYRKGSSVKRFGPFSELSVLIPFPKSAPVSGLKRKLPRPVVDTNTL